MGKLAIGFVSACLMAYGQQTWNGLRFGMSKAEIRAAANKLGLKEIVKARPTAEALAREGIAAPAPGTKETLMFSGFKVAFFPVDVGAYVGAQGTLESVGLVMTIPFKEADSRGIVDGWFEASRAQEEFNKKLTETYGKPVTSKGECTINSTMLRMLIENPYQSPYSCERLWVQSDQHINMSWYFLPEKFFLSVIYEPKAKGL